MGSTTGPVAGRLRRPGWTDPRLLIGLVLIASAVALTAWTVARADHTMPYYAARDTLVPGQAIDAGDLVVVRVKVSADEYVASATDLDGLVATRVIEPGELVPASALSPSADVSTRPVAIEASRPLSEEVVPGAVVDVWVTTHADGAAESRLVAQGLVVSSVGDDGGAFAATAADVVYVVVDASEVGELLTALAGDGEVAVVAGGAAT